MGPFRAKGVLRGPSLSESARRHQALSEYENSVLRTALEDRRNGKAKRDVLFTKNRAAFEILTDETDHGLPVQA